MKPIKSALDELESRLRSLIESKSTRLFSPKKEQGDLISQMIMAMTSASLKYADGRQVAPNLYTLVVPPKYGRILQEDRFLIEELSRTIYETGMKAGYYFDTPPIIKVSVIDEESHQQIRVIAEITPGELASTSTIPTEVEEPGGIIPLNAFLIVGGSQVFPLEKTVINIGRRSDNDLVIDDGQVSRLHAQLRAINGRYVIFDLDSIGGTKVNGERITKCNLYPGDVILLANFPLVYGQEEEYVINDADGLTRPIQTSLDGE
jgi:pSer/pThr/pTyr-binding forkhead associated (FHA) protein